jgi:hydrogenase maturation protein HypF
VVSCLVDNGATGRVIGVAFDGLGHGTDGTLWGGEFLLADLGSFVRVGHLATVPMPGGTTAIREPWRMAAAYLALAFEGDPPPLPLIERHHERWTAVSRLAASGTSPLTSSAGRLFDAVAAILGVRDRVSYEGQAAIELEQIADIAGVAPYGVSTRERGAAFEIPTAELVRAVAGDVRAGVPAPVVASRFHETVAEVIRRGCRLARERSGLATVALSGGVFQNVRLLGRAIELLEDDGFSVLRHRQVPPNDGGISLGQAVVAACRPA